MAPEDDSWNLALLLVANDVGIAKDVGLRRSVIDVAEIRLRLSLFGFARTPGNDRKAQICSTVSKRKWVFFVPVIILAPVESPRGNSFNSWPSTVSVGGWASRSPCIKQLLLKFNRINLVGVPSLNLMISDSILALIKHQLVEASILNGWNRKPKFLGS